VDGTALLLLGGGGGSLLLCGGGVDGLKRVFAGVGEGI